MAELQLHYKDDLARGGSVMVKASRSTVPHELSLLISHSNPSLAVEPSAKASRSQQREDRRQDAFLGEIHEVHLRSGIPAEVGLGKAGASGCREQSEDE